MVGSNMKKKMSWDSILLKLKKGIALTDRMEKASTIHRFNSEIDQIAYTSARSTHQLDGFGDGFGEAGIVAQLQTGEMFPDEMFGWSTKTILAVLLALTVLKLKKSKGS